MNRRQSRLWRGVMGGFALALLGGLGVDVAAAQSVRGSGIIHYAHGVADGGNWFYKTTVNAWVDSDGVAQGMVAYQGAVPLSLPHPYNVPGGPANPYILAVTDLDFDGNTVWVKAVVIASPEGPIGAYLLFKFTDNSGTAEPDEIDDMPIEAGRITVIN